ncbi:MAG: alpha/beta fold hydrolase [Acidimicrobiales bacterium]
MTTMTVSDSTIDYQDRFDGEPVLLIHGAVVADSYEQMIAASDELQAMRLVTYHRRGFGTSTQPDQPRTIVEEAGDALALLDHLDIANAHVVGHSLAGLIAIQIAIDSPQRVHSLTLLEPAFVSVPSGANFAAGVEPSAKLYDDGDLPGALGAFLALVGGDNPMARLVNLPNEATSQAVADLATLFTSDLNALSTFELDESTAARTAIPTLIVRGTDSPAVFQEAADLLTQWLPNISTHTLNGSSHFLQMEQPSAAATALARFINSHTP